MATEAEKKTARASTKLTWHEFMAMAGGVLLAISLFLPWYSVENRRGTIGNGERGPGDFTGWEVTTSSAGSSSAPRPRRSSSPTSSCAGTSCRGRAAR